MVLEFILEECSDIGKGCVSLQERGDRSNKAVVLITWPFWINHYAERIPFAHEITELGPTLT